MAPDAVDTPFRVFGSPGLAIYFSCRRRQAWMIFSGEDRRNHGGAAR
jgi:hypothetical protein